MIYKVTAKTPKGNLTVEVEGESKFRCLDLAQHYFRKAFGEDLADNDIWWKEVTDTCNLDKQIALLFKDIANAPTGGVDSDFNIRHLNEQLSDVFIRTLAGHLIASGWRKE